MTEGKRLCLQKSTEAPEKKQKCSLFTLQLGGIHLGGIEFNTRGGCRFLTTATAGDSSSSLGVITVK